MKKLLTYLMISALIMGSFTACEDDDKVMDPPTFAGATISDDNEEVTVTFSKGVYLNDDGTGALTDAAFDVTIVGGNATVAGFTVDHNEGENAAVIMLDLEGVATGDEMVTISAISVYDADGAEMDATLTTSVTLSNLGIAGSWYSSGDNVAPLLSTYFNVDSVYAEFFVNQTYTVESYDADGVMTEYLGTYTQTESDVDGIWTIVLNQSSPSSLTSEGIFGFFLNETSFDMKYEVVQTEPDLGNAPPTPEGGFGSSNGGALGESNIQQFVKYD